jgi:poly(3-hydroxybutyrate) depolymerase
MSLAYVALELHRQLAQPLNTWARLARAVWAEVPGGGPFEASAEMLEAATRIYGKPSFGLESTTIDGAAVAVHECTVLESPFCRLVRFEREARREGDPKLLIVAPLSGHHATLLRETVRELLPDHDIYLTDWVDARLVRQEAGPFGLHDYIDLIKRFVGAVGEGTHVMAVCQPCVPVLAAVAVMAQESDPRQPRSMTLLSGPIDARVSPTRVDKFALAHSLARLEQTVIHTVPGSLPGRGRRVYPGVLQLQAFISLDIPRHTVAHTKHWFDVALGNDQDADKHRRFYDEYFAVMDLPAEFYLETVSEVFQRFTLAKGEMEHRGRLVRPGAIARTALCTIEGEEDDITGLGQTRAAHDLCTSIPKGRRHHHVEPGVGHYGTFSGRGWREGIAPVVRAFIRRHG